MTNRRRAVAAVALTPLLLAGPASADSILSDIVKDAAQGCYGAVVTVCNPRVSSNPLSWDSTPVPVCAGSCQTVNVPTPEDDGDHLCVSWSSSSGAPSEFCLTSDPD